MSKPLFDYCDSETGRFVLEKIYVPIGSILIFGGIAYFAIMGEIGGIFLIVWYGLPVFGFGGLLLRFAKHVLGLIATLAIFGGIVWLAILVAMYQGG